VTDAWLPQVNGVTTTLSRCRQEIEDHGHEVRVITPDLFKTVPCPRYPEIRLALWSWREVHRMLRERQPAAIHIATEGPLGLAARSFCRRNGLPFTTSFHTKFPDYVRAYVGVPKRLTYRAVRWFHGAAERTLVPTPSIQNELEDHGFSNIVCWTRGVDTALFRPRDEPFYELPKPVYLYAGRVAVEKNLAAFLELELPGSKVVVGDGPARERLERRHPDVHWAGFRFGEDLAQHYAGADVFVFPSLTDTFGVVMLEANACGLPIAAYPVPGPADVVRNGTTGILDEDLGAACRRALDISPSSCRQWALHHSWERCARMLFENLAVIPASVERCEGSGVR
jgi:glycosyltransferase involved in cell wall biosynthesis